MSTNSAASRKLPLRAPNCWATLVPWPQCARRPSIRGQLQPNRVPSVSAIDPAPRTPGHLLARPGGVVEVMGGGKENCQARRSREVVLPIGGGLHDGWHCGLGRTCSGHRDRSGCQRPGGSAGLRRMAKLLGGTSPGPHAASAEQPCSLTRKDAWIDSTWWRRSRSRDAMMKVHGKSRLLAGREGSSGTAFQLQRRSRRIASSVPCRDSRRHTPSSKPRRALPHENLAVGGALAYCGAFSRGHVVLIGLFDGGERDRH
jgi:hypothetical protein